MSSRDATAETSPSGFLDEQDVQTYSSFDDMHLDWALLKGIYGYGWESPTLIQQKTIVQMKDGRDIVAQEQSGKGKTGAFAIAALSIVDCSIRQTQVLILSPTRELTLQTLDVLDNISRNMEGFLVASCVGGTAVRDCIASLRQGPQIVVGTPGRVKHMIDRGSALNMRNLRAIVLDEADEMFDRGFRDSMYDIFEFCPENVQVCLFSATYNDEVLEIANRCCRNPFRILIKQEHVPLDGIKQYFVHCEQEKYKIEVLCNLYECISISALIIFVNSKTRVEQLHDALTGENHTCSCIHGGMTTEERELRMKEFRSGASRVLISTDLLARGIDVQNVGTVINYDLPHNNFSNYIHRIGRSGRHGKKGLALNFVTDNPRDTTTIRELERFYNTKIEELPQDIADVEH